MPGEMLQILQGMNAHNICHMGKRNSVHLKYDITSITLIRAHYNPEYERWMAEYTC